MAEGLEGKYIEQLPGGILPVTNDLKVILEGVQTGYNTVLALATFFNKHVHSNKAVLDKFSVTGEQLLYNGQPIAGVTRHRLRTNIFNSVLNIDFDNKNEVIVTSVGGGDVLIRGNFSISLTNTNNAEYAHGFIELTREASIELPPGTITSSTLTLQAGHYQFIMSNNGAFWRFVIGAVESLIL